MLTEGFSLLKIRILQSYFCSLENKIIIEVDGKIHEKQEVYNLDREKEFLLIQKGYKIIRITNDEIYKNINNVIEKIVASFP